jgi:hypothetical protein
MSGKWNGPGEDIDGHEAAASRLQPALSAADYIEDQ